MRNPHTSQILHVNLAGVDTRDYHLEQSLHEMYFNTKIDEILKIYHIFGIADENLVVGYDSDDKDNDETL